MERPRKVLTIGTFDTPHVGHAIFLSRCASLGDLVVALNTDEFVERFKRKPLFSYQERAALLEKLGYEVVVNVGNEQAKTIIDLVSPDILAIGTDWATKDYYKQLNLTQEWLDKKKVQLVYLPYTKEISTTLIIERIK